MLRVAHYVGFVLVLAIVLVLVVAVTSTHLGPVRKPPWKDLDMTDPTSKGSESVSDSGDGITIFMCGDVMTGRGIDQVLPHPSDSRIHEPYVKDAREYVRIAEKANGPIPKPVDSPYIWGEALDEFERVRPDVKLINLETSVTKSDDYWKHKGINYRMHPENIPCTTAAGIDCCALANNHVLDWGYSGLAETLETLRKAGIKTAGAGRNREEAEAPAVVEVAGKGRVIVFSLGSETSGIPFDWAATESRAGVNLLRDYSEKTIQRIKRRVQEIKRERDIVIASIHWGSNWGYDVDESEREFAHRLIDEAGVDVIHGHSSHHVKGVEVYNGRLILYGCGDFINDYEGIGGYETFRGDLSLMYFATVEPSSGKLLSLHMTPTQMKQFRVNRASRQDALWLTNVLNREGDKFGTRFDLDDDTRISAYWK